MEYLDCGRPRQDGGLAYVEREKRLQQYLQGQKGNDLAWRLRRRRRTAEIRT